MPMMKKPKVKKHNTGLRDTWKLWRHCMCRHGWYPLIVAPFITAAGLLDIYSSLDCKFIHVKVGFDPANEEWSEPTGDLSFWSYHSGKFDPTSKMNLSNTTQTQSLTNQFVLPGCTAYSNEFKEYFVQGDRAWAAAKIMAMSSGIASLTAISTIWLMTLCPLPASFVWPGILLPAALVGFLAGGAKLFILDSVLCTNRVWLREGSDVREAAESCSLQQGAFFSIGSICCFFICICLIFYNVPQKRDLDPEYGMDGQFEEFEKFEEEESIDIDLEKGPTKGHSRDPSMEMIPEDVPYLFASPRKYFSEDIEVRDTSIPQVARTPPEHTAMQEYRDDENNDLESVMNKIGLYLKQSGSDIDFEQSHPTHSPRVSPERDVKRVRSHANKMSTSDDPHSSYLSHDSRKSKFRERLPKSETNSLTIDVDDVDSTKTNHTNVEKSTRDDNLCDISAVTVDNTSHNPANVKGYDSSDVSDVGSSVKSVKGKQRQMNTNPRPKYRVY